MQKLACMLFVLAVAFQEISSTHVVCYYTNWSVYRKSISKFRTSDIDPSLCSIINYAYLGLSGSTGHMFEIDPWSDENLGSIKNVTNLKHKKPSLKVLASVGGWNAGSNNFSKVADNEKLRTNFVNSALDFIEKHNFDGLDIDWTYPTKRHGSSSDVKNYIQMLKELKKAFKPKGYLLTAAVIGAGPIVDDAYDVKNLIEHVDYLNLNLFDLRIAPSCNYTAHHSPLHYCSQDVTDDEKELCVKSGVEHWVKKGAHISKLILGMGLYGRSFELADRKKHGLYAPSKGVGPTGPLSSENGTISYQEICKFYGDFNIVWNDELQAPYSFSASEWFSYDDPKSVTLKTKYAVSKGMGGVMVWSLNLDDFNGSCGQGKYPLLSAINKALK